MVHPNFSLKPCNMHHGLCTYEFNLFGLFAALYSYSPIILTIYNLPPRICLRLKFMFLFTVIPSPYSSGRNTYVCLQSLIDEFKQLWLFKALMSDIIRKHNF
jgi:hypothetical protein